MWPHMQCTPVVYVPISTVASPRCSHTHTHTYTHSTCSWHINQMLVSVAWHNNTHTNTQLRLIKHKTRGCFVWKQKVWICSKMCHTHVFSFFFLIQKHTDTGNRPIVIQYGFFYFTEWKAQCLHKTCKNINIEQWRWTALYPSGNKQHDENE